MPGRTPFFQQRRVRPFPLAMGPAWNPSGDGEDRLGEYRPSTNARVVQPGLEGAEAVTEPRSIPASGFQSQRMGEGHAGDAADIGVLPFLVAAPLGGQAELVEALPRFFAEGVEPGQSVIGGGEGPGSRRCSGGIGRVLVSLLNQLTGNSESRVAMAANRWRWFYRFFSSCSSLLEGRASVPVEAVPLAGVCLDNSVGS